MYVHKFWRGYLAQEAILMLAYSEARIYYYYYIGSVLNGSREGYIVVAHAHELHYLDCGQLAFRERNEWPLEYY